ncbi:MAG: hypothetical protein Fues2KO_32190 [Fuerstiella sp.]
MLPPEELTVSVQHSVDGTEWTALRYGSLLLSNSVENADWQSDPVCPWACWDCQQAWCAQVCLSHVVRTDSQLIFMPPYRASELFDPASDDSSHKWLPEALIIPIRRWDEISSQVLALPGSDSFPKITDHDLHHLWLQHRPPFAVEGADVSLAEHFRQNCVASHPVELDHALQWLDDTESSLQNEPVIQTGSLVSVEPAPESFNTFYFDSATNPELIAFRVCDMQPLIGGRYILATDGSQ